MLLPDPPARRYVARQVAGDWLVIDRRTGAALPCPDEYTARTLAAGLNLISDAREAA